MWIEKQNDLDMWATEQEKKEKCIRQPWLNQDTVDPLREKISIVVSTKSSFYT